MESEHGFNPKILLSNEAKMIRPRVGNRAYRRWKGLRAPLIWAIGAIFALNLLTGCPSDTSGKVEADDPRKNMAIPVTVGSAASREVPIELNVVGNVQPYATVAIKAQVSGELISVHFEEGQEVKKGDLLFTIDPRPYEAHLNQAKANLAKDRAQMKNAQKQVERNSPLVGKGLVSREHYEQLVANAATLKASVQADEAAVENADLQLKFCSIRSPIDGRAGQLKVNRGNLIKANDNDNPLVIINQIRPIYVSFFVPEGNLAEIKKHMALQDLHVEATIPGDAKHPAQGVLTFVDNAVNQAAGTIQLKATFPNDGKRLWPGQFVNVVLTVTTLPSALVIPSQAVQRGQKGPYVFVVKPDLTAEYRSVVVGRILEDEVVIEKGVTPGEVVVTDGQLRLAPGSHVKIVEGAAENSKDSLQ
jgi:multidrug efflux system membrane fusion protein